LAYSDYNLTVKQTMNNIKAIKQQNYELENAI